MAVSPLHLVLSAPADLGRYGAAALDLNAFRPEQIMFGGDAQLNVVASALTKANFVSAFVPHPEIFSNLANLNCIAQIFGMAQRDIPRTLTHVRFGPISDLRVLKFARNIYMQAEHIRRLEVRASGNLFATSQVIPASIKKVLRYQAGPSLISLGSSQPEFANLAEAFRVGDVESWPSGKSYTAAEISLAANICFSEGRIELESFSDFASKVPVTQQVRKSVVQKLSEQRAREQIFIEASTPPFIVLPFNMADPASLIPDLIRTFARYPGPAEAGLNIAVFPYNAAHRRTDLNRLVRDVNSVASWRNPDICSSQMWVAWVKERVPRSAFRLLFPVAIMDNCDPERDWTEARLRQLDVHIVRLGEVKPTSETKQAHDRLPRYCEFEDLSGQRVVQMRSVSKTDQIEAFALASARSQDNSRLAAVTATQPELTAEAVLRTFRGAA